MAHGQLIAVVTTEEGRSNLLQTGVLTLLAKDEEEQEQLASEIARTMEAWVHKLSNGLVFIIK